MSLPQPTRLLARAHRPRAAAPPHGAPAWVPPVVMTVGLVGAVVVRIAVGGVAGVRNPWAGSVFALILFALYALAPVRARLPGAGLNSALLPGLAGAAALCLVPLVVHLRTPSPTPDAQALVVWVVVVSAVAVAEEALLRGALWDAMVAWAAARGRGEAAAIVVTTVAFALIHVPFYGAGVLPLDLAVGLLLAGLRQWSGGWAAPAIAHTLADLAGWWLR